MAKGPESGAVPAPTGELTLPPNAQPLAPPPADVLGPLAAEIIEVSSAAERLGEQIKSMDEEVDAANAVTAQLRQEWQDAADERTAVEERAARIVTEAYQQALAMGPFEEYASDLQDLSRIAPALPGQLPEADTPLERDSIMLEVEAARRVEADARERLDEADAVRQEIADRRAVLDEQFSRHQAALNTLVSRNAGMLGQAETAREVYENSLAASRGFTAAVNGMQAAPGAVKALQFALSQKGKPYKWANAGPGSYDCSGLVLAAYRTVGVSLPHYSAAQYRRGTPVLASQLLPGDLLFFSTDRSDWRQIHHVAMYIGNGRMVHAPNVGSVVKEAPIYWSAYFGAVRLIPAMPAPATLTPSPSASPSPTATATATATRTATATATATTTTTTTAATTTTTTTTAAATTTTTTAAATTTPPPPAAAPAAAAPRARSVPEREPEPFSVAVTGAAGRDVDPAVGGHQRHPDGRTSGA